MSPAFLVTGDNAASPVRKEGRILHDTRWLHPYPGTMPNAPWSDDENDLLVADYFRMLSADLSGRNYSKAGHARHLMDRLENRSKGAIEYKRRNLSAVLQGLGDTWLPGYLPAYNVQASLEDAVARWLAYNPDWLDSVPALATADAVPLRVEPPPTLANHPLPEGHERMSGIAVRFDAAGRDERNRALGRLGERLALAHERTVLERAGRTDLARDVRWVSREDGDGAGYDIASFSLDGAIRLLEVKTTKGYARTPFWISRNELAVARERHTEWRLFRLWNVSRTPQAFELAPPLESHVSLMPTQFLADFHQ